MRIIVVSNRLPVTIMQEGGVLQTVDSSGGLVSGIRAFLNAGRNRAIADREIIWVGWPGTVIPPLQEAEATAMLSARGYIPVWLSGEMIRQHYLGYCNEVLCPLFHGFPELVPDNEDYWPAYNRVNRQYAAILRELLREDDFVWIHDYHLMCLPAMLHEQGYNGYISFFLHIPFPEAGLMERLPSNVTDAICKGLSKADLVGFNTEEYTANFKSWQAMHAGRETDTKAETFPIGIDPGLFNALASSPEVRNHSDRIRMEMQNRKIILSVNRLDYAKGIKQQLEAFRMLLQNFPQWRGEAVLKLVVVPSRPGLRQNDILKEEIERLVTDIRTVFSTPGYTPVNYCFEHYGMRELVALFAAADVALVTPLKDGMNLVAKEYVASRTDGKGVLVLSSKAGVSHQFKHALLVDPLNVLDICSKLHTALGMEPAGQKAMMATLLDALHAFDIFDWGNSIIARTLQSKAKRIVC